MALDDLLKGLSVFQSGLQNLAQGMAVNDARTQLDQINAQVQNQAEKQQMAQQVGQDLAMRLTQAGASGEKIAGVTQGLVPSANNTQTMQAQREMQQAGFAQQTKEKQMDRDLAIELQGMKNDALGLKSSKQEKALYASSAEKFRKENKASLDSLDKLSALKGILDETPDRVGVEMAKTGLLKMAGEDRVSDADVARAQRDPSLRAGISRKLGLELTGNALNSDREFYQHILEFAQKKMRGNLSKKIKGYAQGTSELADVDATRLESGLRKQLGIPEDEPAPPAPNISKQIQDAKAWLADPNNANHPLRAKIEAKVKAWGSK